MRSPFSYLLFLFLFAYLSAQSQADRNKFTLDSLRKVANSTSGIDKISTLDKIARIYWDTNPDSAIYFSSLAVSEAKRDKSDLSLGEAYNSLGNSYASKRDFEMALEYYYKSKLHREIGRASCRERV